MGPAYEGMDGYFPLVLTTNQVGSFDAGNVTFIGLSDREPALVQQADGLWLRVTAPPPLSDRFFSVLPASTVASDYANTVFSGTQAYDPSASLWGHDWDEAHVLAARISQAVQDGGLGATNRSWDLRVGLGGHVYSLRVPALGETVPPSKTSKDQSIWNDEVWQGVAVSPLNDPGNGSPYFLHQSGPYIKDPIQKEPFYSPQVAATLDASDRSYTTINWTPHGHSNIYSDENPSNDFKSYVLSFTRYQDLGQGLLEVTLGYYNYGPDLITWLNMPWGGVRRTSTEYAFISEVGGTTWGSPPSNGFGAATPSELNDTGGWVGFSASDTGATPALGLVFGQDAHVLPTNSVGASWYRWGYAGGAFSTNETSWRNYFVSSNIRRYNLSQGNGIWSRTYFVLGDDISDLSSRIAARNVVDIELREFAYTEATTPKIGYSFTGSGSSFRVTQNDTTPDFYLYAYPVAQSFPIFEVIENNGARYLSWNPHANGMVKPYDGTMAGLRLLGFALPTASTNAEGTSYTYDALNNVLAGVSANYIADGETLSVRLIEEPDSTATITDAGKLLPHR